MIYRLLETALVGVEWWGQREEETANQSNWTSTLLWGHTLGSLIDIIMWWPPTNVRGCEVFVSQIIKYGPLYSDMLSLND